MSKTKRKGELRPEELKRGLLNVNVYLVVDELGNWEAAGSNLRTHEQRLADANEYLDYVHLDRTTSRRSYRIQAMLDVPIAGVADDDIHTVAERLDGTPTLQRGN